MEVKQMVFFTVDYDPSIVSHHCPVCMHLNLPTESNYFIFYILCRSEIHARPKQLDVVFETYFKNVIYKVKDIALLQPLKESLTASGINLTI